jgi:MinD superfamily P-loop ATPase
MKSLLILSGKGGTGKTTTAAAFIGFSSARAFADCDVDAPNLHLLESFTEEPVVSEYNGSEKAQIDINKCIGCGRCKNNCRFNAIYPVETGYQVNELLCEGCGACEIVCPAGAPKLHSDVSGSLMLYKNNEKVFSSAELKMGRGNSGKLVSEVKNQLNSNVYKDTEVVIIDGSPGIGCPVIASISGVDLVLIVTEPTVSGMSDMKRIIETAQIFKVKIAVCVNKYDISEDITLLIEDYCKKEAIDFVGKIPYDSTVSEGINKGIPISSMDCKARDELEKTYIKTMECLFNE